MSNSTLILFYNLTHDSLAYNLSINYFPIDTNQNVTYYETISYLEKSSNMTDMIDSENGIRKRSLAEILLVCVALGSLILATIIGNIFVISAIILEKNLKTVGNYLVLSLAVTDLMVACLVMPLGAVYEVTQEWTLGSSLCELWTCTDVLCCTASILHLLAIALDRFWAVTNVDYVHQRNARHIGAMIITVWVISAVISLAPILGWKDSDFNRRIEEEKKCLVSQDISYQIFATVFSFYGPSALVLILYYRIYLVAKKRIRRKSSSAVNRKQGRPNSCPSAPNTYTSSTEMTTMTCNISSSNASSDNGSSSSYQILVSTNTRHLLPPQPYPPVINTTATNTTTNTTSIVPDFISGASTSDYLEVLEVPSIEFQKDSNSSVSVNNNSFDLSNCTIIHINGDPNVHKLRSQPLKRLKMRKKAANEREIVNKRERKAAKTLAIITGIFIVCWLPFFAVALLMPLCSECEINPYLFSFCLWLGWANSSVNPFLYTIFSPDFRSAFRRMIFGRKLRTKR